MREDGYEQLSDSGFPDMYLVESVPRVDEVFGIGCGQICINVIHQLAPQIDMIFREVPVAELLRHDLPSFLRDRPKSKRRRDSVNMPEPGAIDIFDRRDLLEPPFGMLQVSEKLSRQTRLAPFEVALSTHRDLVVFGLKELCESRRVELG